MKFSAELEEKPKKLKVINKSEIINEIIEIIFQLSFYQWLVNNKLVRSMLSLYQNFKLVFFFHFFSFSIKKLFLFLDLIYFWILNIE